MRECIAENRRQSHALAKSRVRGPTSVEAPSRVAHKTYPPNEALHEDTLLAPKDFHVNQAVRVLELKNEDLWIKSSDTSWHLPLLVTRRELPCKNWRQHSQA